METPLTQSNTRKRRWKSLMRSKRSTSEDRQKLTETAVEDDETFCSTDTTSAETDCPPSELERIQRLQFSAATPRSPRTGNACVTVHVSETSTAGGEDTASPIRSDKPGRWENSSIAAEPVGEHRRAHDDVTSSNNIQRIDADTDDVTRTIHIVGDLESPSPSRSSACNDNPDGHCIAAEVEGQDEVSFSRKTKKSKRRQKAKRYAKQTGMLLWRGVRLGAKVLYNGMVMLAATSTLNFNVAGGAATAWKQWSADQEEQQRNQQQWQQQQSYNRNYRTSAW